MMNKKIAALVLAVSVIGGVGTGVVANALTTDDPATDSRESTASPTTPVTTTASSEGDGGGEAGMVAPDKLTIAPGAVGPVEAGMSKTEALATGYFVADVPAPVDGCPVQPLTWKDKYAHAYDVQTLGNGEVTSIGVRTASGTTSEGLGVGSTYDEVAAQYPDEALVEAGYGQSGLRFYDPQDGRWIGFLFDQAPETITGGDRVTFVELTKGAEPNLMRDGC